MSLGDVVRAVVDPPPEASGSDPSSWEGIVGRLRSDAWRSLDEVRVADISMHLLEALERVSADEE